MRKFNFSYTFDIFLWIAFALIYLFVHTIYDVFNQAYFWDELGVYSRASEYMFLNGLGILPSNLPDELSRGHPVLLPFVFASAFKIFGIHVQVAHITAAIWSCTGFYFLFLIAKKYVQPALAMCMTLAVFVQPALIAQSTLILPEMPLMAFTAAALYFYIDGKFKLCSLFIVLALQIKESALILPFVFYLASILQKPKFSFFTFVFLFLIPIISFLVFIGIQKLQRDYFFYPLHTSLLSFDTYYIRERWHDFLSYFYTQAAWVISFLITIFYSKKLFVHHKNLIVIPLLLLSGLSFLVLNYYLSRYTLYFIAPSILLALVLLALSKQLHKTIVPITICVFAIFGILKWESDKFTDANFSPYYHVNNLKQCIHYLDEAQFENTKIYMDFPLVACYWSRFNGYNTAYKKEITCNRSDSSEYKVFTHPGNMHDTAQLNAHDSLINEMKFGYAYSRVYKIKHSHR